MDAHCDSCSVLVPCEATVGQRYVQEDDASPIEFGWCWWDSEYPEEGACGPFDTEDEAIENACAQGYAVRL